MMTPSGCVAAKLLKEGDHLISTSRPEIFPDIFASGSKAYVNNTPAPAQDVFSADSFSRDSVFEIMPTAIDLHGDGQFVNGAVDIIASNGSLGGEFNSPLGQPHAQKKIGAAGQLKRNLHRLGASLQGGLRSLAAPFSNMSFGHQRLSFGYAHTGISQADVLSQGSQFKSGSYNSFGNLPIINARSSREGFHSLSTDIGPNPFAHIPQFGLPSDSKGFARAPSFYASTTYATENGRKRDAKLVSNLLEAFPGLIALDRIIGVEIGSFAGHVFDFSTNQGWYIADSIVTHNCTAAGAFHLGANILGLAGKSVPFTADEAVEFYSGSTGYVPGESWTDQGGNEPDVLNYWRAHGLVGGQHKISGWVQVDAGNQRELQVGVYLFGGLYLGLCLPDAYEPTGDFNNGFLWDVEGDSDPSNGHCIVALGYSRTGLIVDTWGYLGTLTWAAVAKYCSSDSNGMINAVVSPDIIESVTRKSPSGLYFSQLLADFDHFFGA
jgi:hypothetical protein